MSDAKMGRSRSQSLPRRLFDTIEARAAADLEALVGTDAFAEFVVARAKFEHRVNSMVSAGVDTVLHRLQIPTRADVRRLHEHLAALESLIAESRRDGTRGEDS